MTNSLRSERIAQSENERLGCLCMEKNKNASIFERHHRVRLDEETETRTLSYMD